MPSERILVQQDEALLARHNRAIEFYDSIVAQLRNNRDLVQSRIDTRRAYDAPIRPLPLELTSRVLLLACSGKLYNFDDRPIHPIALHTGHSHHQPLNLALVCKLWKVIVFRSPHLWHALTVSVPRSTRQAEILKQTLDRSLPHPLRLSVDGGDWYPRQTAPLLPEHTSLVASTINRSCDLHVSYDFMAGTALEGIRCPDLKRLYLFVRGAYTLDKYSSFAHPQLAAILQSPSLGQFWSDTFQWLSIEQLYQAGAISSFKSHQGSVSYEQLMELVKYCPHIKSLLISLQTSSFHRGPITPLTLPHLKRLEYRYHCPDPVFLLERLTTPRLVDLIIPEEPIMQGSFVRFLDRSGCRIESLDCHMLLAFDRSDDCSSWSGIFARIPQLQSLWVKLAGAPSWEGVNAFEVFCEVLGEPQLPHLMSLNVRANSGGWRDLNQVEMEQVVTRFLGLASRTRQNHHPLVVPLEGVGLYLGTTQT
ncbi:hypothetical protein V5O48_011575 [Marasmius crinis-equi]|uniref:F-box domain-containing protein n=1 Tax=Marasmius crinis-equi TaxID=585013 RepID=A0ABR3F562_9AGAR